MTDWDKAFARLSPEEQISAMSDAALFGQAFIKVDGDAGTYVSIKRVVKAPEPRSTDSHAKDGGKAEQ